MPRSRSIPEQLWPVGVHQADVDNFTNGNTDRLTVTVTQPANGSGWPTDVATLGTLRVEWGDGSFAECPIPSQPTVKGQPVNSVSLTVNVPRTGNGKKNVSNGFGRMTVDREFIASVAITAS